MFVARSFKSLVAPALLLCAPFAFGSGGGDSDSPFNLPNNPGSTGGGSSAVSAAQDPIYLVPTAGSTLTLVASSEPFNGGARAIVANAAIVSDGRPILRDVTHATIDLVKPLPGTELRVHPLDADTELQGRFRIRTEQPVRLTGDPKAPAHHAILIVGALDSARTGLESVMFAQQIAMPAAGIDVTAMMHDFAAKAETFGVENLAVQVIVPRGNTTMPAATAVIGVKPDATVLIDTSPKATH